MISKNKQKQKELIYKRVRAFYKTGMYSLDEVARVENKSRQWVWLVVTGRLGKESFEKEELSTVGSTKT